MHQFVPAAQAGAGLPPHRLGVDANGCSILPKEYIPLFLYLFFPLKLHVKISTSIFGEVLLKDSVKHQSGLYLKDSPGHAGFYSMTYSMKSSLKDSVGC